MLTAKIAVLYSRFSALFRLGTGYLRVASRDLDHGETNGLKQSGEIQERDCDQSFGSQLHLDHVNKNNCCTSLLII
jgi:hypothetical protein